MNLEDIQATMVGWLKAVTEFATVPIITDDGTYPKIPAREAALRSPGLCLIVSQVQSDGIVDVSAKGLAVQRVYLGVAIEENVQVNRATGGTLIPAEKALRLVQGAITGQPRTGVPNESFLPSEEPFTNLGVQAGLRRIVVNFTHVAVILPSVPPPAPEPPPGN